MIDVIVSRHPAAVEFILTDSDGSITLNGKLIGKLISSTK